MDFFYEFCIGIASVLRFLQHSSCKITHMKDIFYSNTEISLPVKFREAEKSYFLLAREHGLGGKQKIFVAMVFLFSGFFLVDLPFFTWFHELGHVLFAFFSGGGGKIFSPTMAIVTVDNVFVSAGGAFTQVLVGVLGFWLISRYGVAGWPLAGMSLGAFLGAPQLTDFNWDAALVTFYVMTVPVMLFLSGLMVYRFYQYGVQIREERKRAEQSREAMIAYFSAGSTRVVGTPGSTKKAGAA